VGHRFWGRQHVVPAVPHRQTDDAAALTCSRERGVQDEGGGSIAHDAASAIARFQTTDAVTPGDERKALDELRGRHRHTVDRDRHALFDADVEAGSLLVEIDQRTPRNRLSETEAALVAARARRQIAETQMQRAAALFKSQTLTQADYEQAPESVTVRELRTGGKTLVTTLLYPKQADKAALKSLYQSRWHVELDLRNIKTTLGMERLSCQRPAMAIKEIWVYLLAYNLVRLMMAQAALLADRLPRQLSFKHTVQIWIAWAQHGHGTEHDDRLYGLFVLIAQQRVGQRPGRIEPRAIKRRPKPYPLLTQTRALSRAHVRKHGHPEKLK